MDIPPEIESTSDPTCRTIPTKTWYGTASYTDIKNHHKPGQSSVQIENIPTNMSQTRIPDTTTQDGHQYGCGYILTIYDPY